MCIRVIVNGEHVDTVGDLCAEMQIKYRDLIFLSGIRELVPPHQCLCGIDIAATAERNGFQCAESDEPGVDYVLTQ